MNRLHKPLKLGIFYDGNFFIHASNYYYYFHEQNSRLCIDGLHNYIIKRVAEELECGSENCFVVESHYYRGRINAVEASQRGNQLYNDRVFEDILMAEGVQTHYLPLRNTAGRREERGIEVLLSLDALEMALTEKIDIAVLVISDIDYAPLIRKLHSLGVRTTLLSWEFEYENEDKARVITKTSQELMQLASFPILMHEEIEDGLLHEDPSVISLFVDSTKTKDANAMADIEIDDTVYESEVLSLKTGFGFISFTNNNLYFNHQDVIVGDFFTLVVGDMVEFTIGLNHKGEQVAKNVKKIL